MTHKPGWEKDRCDCVLSIRGATKCWNCRSAAWEKDRAKWQVRYDLSRKHPELYPQELDAIMADWEPDAPAQPWPEGKKAERPQRPPATNDPDCPF